MKDHTLLGYVLLRPSPKGFTVVDCLSDVLPNFPLLSWDEDYAAEARKRFLAKKYLDESTATKLAAKLTKLVSEEKIEFASRFYDIADVREVRAEFFPEQPEWKIVGYGVPESQLAALETQCKEGVQSGILSSLQHGLRFPPVLKKIGYDVMNVEQGEFAHSFLCNDLQGHAKLNASGLLETEAEATALAKKIAAEDLGEPGPWFPVLVTSA